MQMIRRRVKITGIGPVTPAGIGRKAFSQGILESVSRVRAISSETSDFGPFVGAVVDGFDINDYIKRFPGQNGAARHTQFALAGAILALKDAGIPIEEFSSGAKALLASGTSLMDCEGLKRSYDQVAKLGVKGAYTRAVFSANVASIASTVANALGLSPRMIAMQSSCCSGLDAVGYAAREIAEGKAEVALCGGTEAPLFTHPMIELRAAGLMSHSAEEPHKQCRPFDLWRTTGAVSEGACMFVLEPEASPRKGYAYIDGYAFSSDNQEGPCRGMFYAMQSALADARLSPKAIDVINAWGPGHREIDAAESRELINTFGSHLQNMAATSIKGAVGNPLGAAGAIQVASASLGLQQQMLTPTVNWEMRDPACPLNLFSQATKISHSTVLINAHGISGSNSALILSR